MKCSCCGKSNFYKVPAPFCSTESDEFGGRNQELYHEIDTCICLNCGHYEFFNLTAVGRINSQIKEAHERLPRLEAEQAKRQEEVNYYMDINNRNVLAIKLEKLYKQAKNEDITVKELNELQVQIRSVQEELCIFDDNRQHCQYWEENPELHRYRSIVDRIVPKPQDYND